MKIIRNIFFGFFIVLIIYFVYESNFSNNNSKEGALKFLDNTDSVSLFEGITGPKDTTIIPPFKRSDWRIYSHGADYGIGVFLSDTGAGSCWLGLVHTFKSFGIPFKLTTNIDTALKHDVVLIYPEISYYRVDDNVVNKVNKYLKQGGTVIGDCVVNGPLLSTFGITSTTHSTTDFKIDIYDTNNPLLKEFTNPKEREISLGDPDVYHQTMDTYEYRGAKNKPLLTFKNGTACMVQNSFPDGGKTYSFAIDLGYFFLTCQNGRSYNAYRTFCDGYEPTLDVVARIIKNIYLTSAHNPVILSTLPTEKKLTVCFTHDIDYKESIFNAVDYATMENKHGITATYFVQVKYIHDWNDVAFYNNDGVECLNKIRALNMEIASHSVSHSRVFKLMPIGDGTEKYPFYHPVVKSKTLTSGGDILGELRVSKFLLEKTVNGLNVISFRPGHLSNPFSLTQCLLATGYKYASTMTSNYVLTHLPFQMNYDHEFQEEMPLFEFPITIEDERIDMSKRLDSVLILARQLMNDGGFMCFLIHPNIIGYKYRFEDNFIDSMKKSAYFCSLRQYAEWWEARNDITFYISNTGKETLLHIHFPKEINMVSFYVPEHWKYEGSSNEVSQNGQTVYIHHPLKDEVINFTVL